MSMKAMLEAMMVAASTQGPRSGPVRAAALLRYTVTIALTLLSQLLAIMPMKARKAGDNTERGGNPWANMRLIAPHENR
jgi:hypothetical protein